MTPESARNLAHALLAWADGKQVEKELNRGIWRPYDFGSWNDCNHRVKPEPKYRPFLQDDAPVGHLIKHKTNNFYGPTVILYKTHYGLAFYGNNGSLFIEGYVKILEDYFISYDKGETWTIAGIKEI